MHQAELESFNNNLAVACGILVQLLAITDNRLSSSSVSSGPFDDLLQDNESLPDNLNCLISIGTGQPGYKPFEDTILGIGKTLLSIATETETTANAFHREQSKLFDKKVCFRFNVPRGLGDIGLAETQQRAAIKSMTDDHLQSEIAQSSIRSCVQRLQQRQSQTRTRNVLLLKQVAQDEEESLLKMCQDPDWQLATTEDESQDLLNRISLYRPERRHNLIGLRKIGDTAQWINDDPSFLDWLGDDSQNCLWISGIVGSGKTHIVHTAIQTLLDLRIDGLLPGPIAHFYFNPNERDALKVDDLFRSSVKQLLRHLYLLGRTPSRQIISKLKRFFKAQLGPPTRIEIVHDLLIPIIQEFDRPILAVDGLDICPHAEYMAALDAIAVVLEKTLARVIICGRDELDVIQRIPGSARLEVTLSKTANDVSRFTHDLIKQRMRRRRISNNDSTVQNITSTLIRKAEGMFLWVQFQIDVLWSTCTTDAQIKQALRRLPKSLDETYDRCLERVREEQSPYALRVLRYVHQATKPLMIEALGEALAVDPDSGAMHPDQVPEERFIVSCGANLVVFDELERFVLPAHHSVRQFLETSRSDILERLRVDISEDADRTLGEICVAHLWWHAFHSDAKAIRKASQGIQTTTVQLPSVSQIGRWMYSPHRLTSRLRKPWQKAPPSHPNTGQSPVLLKVPQSVQSSRSLYSSFHAYARAEWTNLTRSLTRDSTQWEQFRDLVYKHHEDLQLLRWSGKKQRTSDQVDTRVQVLGWAIANRHAALLELAFSGLKSAQLAKDISNSALTDYENMLPLHLAAKLGQLDAVKRLFQLCDVLVRCPNSGWSALHYAVEQKHVEVVKFLLNSPQTLINVCDDGPSGLVRITIAAGSLKILDLMEATYGQKFWNYPDFETLLRSVFSTGVNPEISVYVLRRFLSATPDRDESRRHILCWIIRHELADSVSILVKAEVSLNTEICAAVVKADPTMDRTFYPSVFFTLEARTPDLAAALFNAGADTERPIEIQPSGARFWPADLALSRGWIDLASGILEKHIHEVGHRDVPPACDILVKDSRVCWLSLKPDPDDTIITNVSCTSYHVCVWRPKCLYVSYKKLVRFHALRIDFSRPRWNSTNRFTVMRGTRQTIPTTWRTLSDTRHDTLEPLDATIKCNGYEAKLTFNHNPYNLQYLKFDGNAMW